MSSFKKLNRPDTTYLPYVANKQWTISNAYFSISGSFIVYAGTNITGTFYPSNSAVDPVSNGQYQRLVYDSINHMFYQAYNGDALNTQSLMFNANTYTSASQQRPTSSYFIYDTNANQIKNFPSGTGQTIRVLAVNQNVFGTKILPYTFVATSSVSKVTDDGNGNLFVGGTHIGNIFYSQGIAIITNQSYQSSFPTSSATTFTISFQNEHTVYENEVRCIVKESEFNLSYNPTLNINSDGSLRDFATGSDFYPYATSIGLYNDNNDLLMVAKFGKPIMISPNTDMTFVVKYDT